MEFIEVWGLAWVPEDLQAKMEIVKGDYTKIEG
jgi:hypothetical protein